MLKVLSVDNAVFNRFLRGSEIIAVTRQRNFSHQFVFKTFIFLTFVFSSNVLTRNAAEEFVSRKNVPLYYDFKTLVTDVQRNESGKKYTAQMLLYLYETECIREKQTHSPDEKRMPFIEIESNNSTVRTELAGRLAKRIGGAVLEDPAHCLGRLEEHFSEYHPLYGAFCSFSMYAVSYNVTLLWHDVPVITTGDVVVFLEILCHLQKGEACIKATYFISKEYVNRKLPVYGSAVYDFPKDLIMPDIAFTVYYEHSAAASEESIKRERNIMHKIHGPPLFDLRTDLTLDEMVETMETEIVRGLRKVQDIDVDFKRNNWG